MCGRVLTCNQSAVCQPHPSPPGPCLSGASSGSELDSFFPPQCLKSDSQGAGLAEDSWSQRVRSGEVGLGCQ